MNVGICGTRHVKGLPPCRCGGPVRVRFAERDGEGETYDNDEELVLCTSHCIEAWIDCPRCGWVSESGEEGWSDEIFLLPGADDWDRPLDEHDIETAVAEICRAWREQRKERIAVAEGKEAGDE